MLANLKRSVYVFSQSVDMRKSYDGFFALVRDQSPLEGEVFCSYPKTGPWSKALHWDGTSFNIWMKRLENGCFANVWKRERLTQS